MPSGRSCSGLKARACASIWAAIVRSIVNMAYIAVVDAQTKQDSFIAGNREHRSPSAVVTTALVLNVIQLAVIVGDATCEMREILYCNRRIAIQLYKSATQRQLHSNVKVGNINQIKTLLSLFLNHPRKVLPVA